MAHEFNEGDLVRVVLPGPVPAGWEGTIDDWDAYGITLLVTKGRDTPLVMFFPWAMGAYVVKEVRDGSQGS